MSFFQFVDLKMKSGSPEVRGRVFVLASSLNANTENKHRIKLISAALIQYSEEHLNPQLCISMLLLFSCWSDENEFFHEDDVIMQGP